jgi:hypothetical protein
MFNAAPKRSALLCDHYNANQKQLKKNSAPVEIDQPAQQLGKNRSRSDRDQVV